MSLCQAPHERFLLGIEHVALRGRVVAHQAVHSGAADDVRCDLPVVLSELSVIRAKRPRLLLRPDARLTGREIELNPVSVLLGVILARGQDYRMVFDDLDAPRVACGHD